MISTMLRLQTDQKLQQKKLRKLTGIVQHNKTFQAQWSCSLIQTFHLTELTGAWQLGMYRCSETPENDNKEISHTYILSLFVSEEYLAASHSMVPKTFLAAKAREDDCIRRLQINTNL